MCFSFYGKFIGTHSFDNDVLLERVCFSNDVDEGYTGYIGEAKFDRICNPFFVRIGWIDELEEQQTAIG